jgi:hypothetical protein
MAVLPDVALYNVMGTGRRFRVTHCHHCQGVYYSAVSTSETSGSLYQTPRRSIPEDCHLHTRRRENLKCHKSGVRHRTASAIRKF